MDKALACQTGGQGLSPDTFKDFFNYEKAISAPIMSGTSDACTLFPSPTGLEIGVLLLKRQKIGIEVKILAAPSVRQTQILEQYIGERG